MLIMWPLRCLRICGSTARLTVSRPKTLMLNTVFTSLSLDSSTGMRHDSVFLSLNREKMDAYAAGLLNEVEIVLFKA